MDRLVTIKDKQFELGITQERLHRRIHELSISLNQHYANASPILVPILQGGLRFAGELMAQLHFPYLLHCAKVKSYGSSMQAEQAPEFILGPPFPEGEQILIIEDIVDKGHTLEFLKQALRNYEVRTVSLLFKPNAYQFPHPPEWVGFEIPNDFVVGYGLDYDEQGRYLNGIYKLRDDA